MLPCWKNCGDPLWAAVCEGSVRWPRPLRSFAQLLGLDGLSARELRQCHTGGNFFLQCVWVLAAHIAYGGIFVAEHPAPPFLRRDRVSGRVR